MASKISSTSNTTTVLSRRLGVLLAVAAGTTTALAQVGLNNWTEAAPEAHPASQPGTQQTGDVKVSDDMTVDLHVKDEELAIVLEMLSLQSQKNIIASKDVSARVTANLYGVTFYEALDAILNVNGYGFVEDGNFIKVYTLDEINKINAAARVKVSQVIPLNYLAAVDAAEFVKPLLSPEGQIKVNSKAAPFASMSEVPVGDEEYAQNSMMVIYDFEENVEQVREMVKIIDTRPAQVLVEATILQTRSTRPTPWASTSPHRRHVFAELVTGPLTASTAVIAGNDGDDNLLPADGAAPRGHQHRGQHRGRGGLKVGIVANDVGVFLRALDEVTDTTIISNPKILTLNRQPSRVLVGRKVGYLSTTSTDTATTQTVEFLDTGTQLYFRPFVTNDGLIRMELKPQVSEAAIRDVTDATGAAVTIPDEITNELVTNVIVRDGQTVVLGGLFRESTKSTRRQVPLLGDIPLIGQAFRGHEDDMNRNEIIFLITPTSSTTRSSPTPAPAVPTTWTTSPPAAARACSSSAATSSPTT
jgi:type IV pilus assembly protein PilQ